MTRRGSVSILTFMAVPTLTEAATPRPDGRPLPAIAARGLTTLAFSRRALTGE